MIDRSMDKSDEIYSSKVSVIICNYNYSQFIVDAIESVLSQKHQNIEIIVVDDGSTDSSPDVLKRYVGNSKVTIVLKTNAGQASAFNTGYEYSSGDFVLFLDSDDKFHPDKIDYLLKEFCLTPSVDRKLMVSHRLEAIDEFGRSKGFTIKIPTSKPSVPPNDKDLSFQQHIHSELRKYRFIGYPGSPTSGLLISRPLAQAIFPLPEQDIITSADDFLVMSSALIGEVEFVEKVLGYYRIHSSNAWYASQSKPKSKRFLQTLEGFMNKKLLENEIEVRASFFDSWYARDFYVFHSKPLQLIRLAFCVPLNYPSLPTIRFCMRTLAMSMALTLKKIVRQTTALSLIRGDH